MSAARSARRRRASLRSLLTGNVDFYFSQGDTHSSPLFASPRAGKFFTSFNTFYRLDLFTLLPRYSFTLLSLYFHFTPFIQFIPLSVTPFALPYPCLLYPLSLFAPITLFTPSTSFPSFIEVCIFVRPSLLLHLTVRRRW